MTAKPGTFGALEHRRSPSGRAAPKKAREDALARQRARERAARDD